MDLNIDEIHVSLDVANSDDYKRVKGKDLFNKVMNNIDRIMPYYETADAKASLYVKIALPEADYQDFWGEKSITKANFNEAFELLNQRFKDSVNAHLKIMPLFSTYMEHIKFIDDKPCEMPFYMVKMKASGDLDACCAAIFGELGLGHIRDGLDVHHRASTIRTAHLSGEVSKHIPMCGTCAAKTAVDVTEIKHRIIASI